MKIKIAKKEIIHFIGIGGIGMSGLSLIMNSQGFKVQGSDININKNIERLKKEKIKFFLGQSKKNLKKATIAVVSSAIKKDNPELIEAKRRNIPIIKRGEMLANLVSLMKNIVVAGSHGKTTTTSLLATIFQETKIDPTIINGGVINAIKKYSKNLEQVIGLFWKRMSLMEASSISRQHMQLLLILIVSIWIFINLCMN